MFMLELELGDCVGGLESAFPFVFWGFSGSCSMVEEVEAEVDGSSCSMCGGWTVQWGRENGCEIDGRKRNELMKWSTPSLLSYITAHVI